MVADHSLEALNNHVLLSQFGALVRKTRESNANLLRYIDVIDRRQLWAQLGYPSMFAYLVTRHHMSESTAAKRIGAARTARRFPVLFAMVACGEIHLSGIHRLKAHLTPENHEQVLAATKHKTIRQVDELVARLAPQPDVPSMLRALPRRTSPAPVAMPTPSTPALASEPAPAPAPASAPTAMTHPPASAPRPTPAPPAPPARPVAIEPSALPCSLPAPGRRRSPDPTPLAPGRYRLQVTLSQNARDKLKQLQDLLAHQIPNGDPAAIVERALDALLIQMHKRKLGSTNKPRARKPSSTSTADASAQRAGNEAAPQTADAAARQAADGVASPTRYLEVAVRREVWARDEGRCGFVGADGHRCSETRGLEFAHIHPWAKGGPHTANNLGLRCIAHNAWEADRDYGASHMASKRKQKPMKLREPIAKYTARSIRLPAAAVDTEPPARLELTQRAD